MIAVDRRSAKLEGESRARLDHILAAFDKVAVGRGGEIYILESWGISPAPLAPYIYIYIFLFSWIFVVLDICVIFVLSFISDIHGFCVYLIWYFVYTLYDATSSFYVFVELDLQYLVYTLIRQLRISYFMYWYCSTICVHRSIFILICISLSSSGTG